MTARGHLRWVTVALLAALAAVSVQAQTLVYEHDDKPLFSIEIPSGWVVDLDFEQEAREAGAAEGEEPRFRIVEVSPRDGSHVWLGLWALPGTESLDDGVAYLKSLRQDLFTDVEMSDPAETKVNGMGARTSRGTAKRDGEAVELAAALFEPHPGAIVAVLYVGEVDAWQVHSAELEAMIGSLEPAD